MSNLERTAAGILEWSDVIVLAATQFGISVSPELIRSAAAWSGEGTFEQAIVDIAGAAGLTAKFVSMPLRDVTTVMLPVLASAGSHVVLITAVSETKASVAFVLSGQTHERTVDIGPLVDSITSPLLLVRERESSHSARHARVDDYLNIKQKSWLRGVFAHNWTSILELGLGSLVGNVLAIATSLFAMQVWDRVVPARSIPTMWVLASGVGLALTFELMIRVARVSIADHFGKAADLRLSAMFFARTLDIKSDARPKSPGTLISQLRDLEQLRELLTSTTMGTLIDLPFVAAFLFIIWVLGGPLVYVPLAAIPLVVLPGLVAQLPLARLSRQGLAESALRNAILMESIHRIEDIKILQAEPRFRYLWDKVNRVSADIGMRQRFIAGLIASLAQLVQHLAYVGVLVAGVYGLLEGGLSFGAVLACSILTSRTIAPLGQVSAVLGRLQNVRVGKKGLDSLLALPVDHDPAKDAYHKPAIRGDYKFENVVFAYSPDDKPALVVPLLKIAAGEKVAVLGRVGAGKSTLLRLIGGLSAPGQGRILISGTSMELIDVSDIRRDVGFLLQDSSLFYGSLRENMRLGNPQATDEQILEAMRIARADQLILNQQHGLDLVLREGGIGLSGGQKQSLILARAILRSPNILLLDEPTASLDESTERDVLEHIKAWLGTRTLVVATHRYSVLALVDRIIVVDGGRIVLDGPKGEVLAKLSDNSTRLQQPSAAPRVGGPLQSVQKGAEGRV